ncbi:hypothetical protein BB039_02150 [Neisseria gonorrhoeae]|nr:predicted protein [Neisseria gonorrhoeae 1291]EEZ43703.1 conserved hypothetical protein [Neisseria gonorrhoeae 35/02]EEZ52606.1 predicted protein [Neisseria gonorrhoeae PID1]EEZ54951.1 predicted protein [Neisseria gonorrhoeae PID332]EEZ57105.1 predicted protein [Neisseria gonorrhoeae SK-92-679]EEZ59419.1 predicted protein [Neisseria gonorrhoeae SK-93-1035]EFF39513.1 hypothetical protein NGNG_00177 [Neisseria gonorrhoeae F62]KDM99397.1 hypothetical protein AW44_02585 [Neisseria gonorrhoeae
MLYICFIYCIISVQTKTRSVGLDFAFFGFRVTSNSSFPRRRESGSSGFCVISDEFLWLWFFGFSLSGKERHKYFPNQTKCRLKGFQTAF